jgi:hypothetical protein
MLVIWQKPQKNLHKVLLMLRDTNYRGKNDNFVYRIQREINYQANGI